MICAHPAESLWRRSAPQVRAPFSSSTCTQPRRPAARGWGARAGGGVARVRRAGADGAAGGAPEQAARRASGVGADGAG